MKSLNEWVGGRGEMRRFAACVVVAMVPVAASAATEISDVMNTPDMTATTLLIVGFALLMLEIKIVSHGLLGVLGSICLIASTIIIWRDGATFWGVPVSWVIPVILLAMIIAGVLSVLAVRAYNSKVTTGQQGFIGEIAEASEPLSPHGHVFFQGAYWKAESSAWVKKGEKVRITAADNLKLEVEPVALD